MGGSSDPVSFEKGGASSDCSHLRPSHFCNVLLLCIFFQLGRDRGGDGAYGVGERPSRPSPQATPVPEPFGSNQKKVGPRRLRYIAESDDGLSMVTSLQGDQSRSFLR